MFTMRDSLGLRRVLAILIACVLIALLAQHLILRRGATAAGG